MMNDTPPLAVAFFDHMRDNKPQRNFLPWLDLVQLLLTHTRRAEKDGPLWSPTAYHDGATRGKDHVESLSCLVLDFDDGVSPAEVSPQWARWEYVLHSTYSHTPDKPKFRAVFPLAYPIAEAEWPAVYRRLALALGQGHTDPACKDCSRIYYLPSAPPEAEVFTDHHVGEWLDPAAFPEREPEPPPETTRPTPCHTPWPDLPHEGQARYTRAALESELGELAAAHPGHRNAQLNDSAFALGQLTGAGLLNRTEVEAALVTTARNIGLEEQEILSTIKSGLDAGEKEPRQVPEPTWRSEPPAEPPPTPTAGPDPPAVIGATAAATDLPEIDAGYRNLPRTTQAVWDALVSSNTPPYLFRYGGRVAWLEYNDHGEPSIALLDKTGFRHVAARAAKWFRWKKEGEGFVRTDAVPPLDVMEDCLALRDKPLPILVGLIEAPTFAPDGTLQTRPGYHPESRLFYAPQPTFQVSTVPLHPPTAEVERAKELLLTDFLGDFPFVGEEEKSHALALLLLLFIRDLIDGPTPLHLIEKPCPGTGAGLLADMLLFPATGRPSPVLTEGHYEDEWRKRITALLRVGAGAIFLDNIRGRLDSAAVSAAITARVWEDRLLGTSDTVKVPVRCAWIASGNNPALSSEITRRTIRIRLDAKTDRPWLRTGFRHPNLRRWAEEHRGDLVGAACTLVQAWLAAGRPQPQTDRAFGMFESWSEVLGGILDYVGVPGFLSNLDNFYEASDTEGAAWRSFLAAWWEKFGDREVGVAQLFDLVNETDTPFDLGEGSERSQKTRLGKALGQNRDRQFDDLRIVAGDVVKRAQQWRLVNVGERGERFTPRVNQDEVDENLNLGKGENVHQRSPRSPEPYEPGCEG